MFPIIGNIPLELLFPEDPVAFGHRGIFTAFMPVPETAVDEDDGFILRQNNVRLAGQGADILPETVSGAVEHGADEDFRLGVFAADPRHVPRTLGWRQVIHAQSVSLCCRMSKVEGRERGGENFDFLFSDHPSSFITSSRPGSSTG